MENTIGIIKKTILGIEKPFKMSDLYAKLAEKGITNKKLILKVLDQLLDERLVDYDDISEENVIYYSRLATVIV